MRLVFIHVKLLIIMIISIITSVKTVRIRRNY